MKPLPALSMCLLSLVLTLPVSAADRTEEVRATEVAFAKAFAERDAKRFFSYLADDAQFLGRQNTMHGKQEVIAGWSEFFKPAVAPFRWQPERVVTNVTDNPKQPSPARVALERLEIPKGLQVSFLNGIARIGFVFHEPAGQVVCFWHERQHLIFKALALVLVHHWNKTIK